MNVLLYFLFASLLQDNIPFKATEEFELTMNYDFRQRIIAPEDTDFRNPITTSGPLPYLELTLKVLNVQDDEARLRIVTNLNEILLNRKVTIGEPYTFEAGYTVDMKDRVEAHEFTVLFTSNRKEKISRIVIHVAEDGTFLVNNEVRGKL